MAVPKKRTTRGSQGQRRSHLALVAPQLITLEGGQLIPRRLKRAAELGLIKLNRKKA